MDQPEQNSRLSAYHSHFPAYPLFDLKPVTRGFSKSMRQAGLLTHRADEPGLICPVMTYHLTSYRPAKPPSRFQWLQSPDRFCSLCIQ